MARNFAGHVEHFEHGGAATDDSFEFEIGEQLIIEGANLRAARGDFGEFVERLDEALVVNRLAKEIVRAATDGFDSGVNRIEAGDEDDRHARINLQGLFQEGKTVHPGHFHVYQNHAAGANAYLAQSVFRARGAKGGKSEAREFGRSDFDQIWLVVQNADGQIVADYLRSGILGDYGHSASVYARSVPD